MQGLRAPVDLCCTEFLVNYKQINFNEVS
jgi:hypothetical protein